MEQRAFPIEIVVSAPSVTLGKLMLLEVMDVCSLKAAHIIKIPQNWEQVTGWLHLARKVSDHMSAESK